MSRWMILIVSISGMQKWMRYLCLFVCRQTSHIVYPRGMHTPTKGSKVNQGQIVHHASWMVCGTEFFSFHCIPLPQLTRVCSLPAYLLTIQVHLLTYYLIATKCLTYLHSNHFPFPTILNYSTTEWCYLFTYLDNNHLHSLPT